MVAGRSSLAGVFRCKRRGWQMMGETLIRWMDCFICLWVSF